MSSLRVMLPLLLTPALWVAGAEAAGPGDRPPTAPPSELRIALGLMQEVYEVGALLRGELTLANPTAQWLTIPEAADLIAQLRLVGEDGREVEPTRPEQFGAARTTRLGPGGFVGVTFDAALLFPALSTPGRYSLAYRRAGWPTREFKFRILPAFDPARPYQLRIAAPTGEVVVQLAAQHAPVAAHNVVNLARVGFYDGADVARLEPGVMLAIRGPVEPHHRIEPFEQTSDECLAGAVLLESVVSGVERVNYPNLIILLSPAPALRGRYTVVGQVVAGFEALTKLAEQPTSGPSGSPPFRPLSAITITRVAALEQPPPAAQR